MQIVYFSYVISKHITKTIGQENVYTVKPNLMPRGSVQVIYGNLLRLRRKVLERNVSH